ncbi:MAG TPA: TMEM175 family protein [Solirubrobacterales bacterium]|nr:TMEM175 family protein [Solirubrobacterales bacterium]
MAKQRRGKRREGNEIEFSRIVAFSDGVFAIAITLLVLALDIPDHLHGESVADALWEQRENLLAYALSFAVIGRFWIVHHRFFSEVTGFDNRLLGLNIFYLAWIVLLPFSSKVLGDHGGETATVVLYAVNLSGVVITGLWMEADARRAGLTAIGADEHREQRVRAGYIAAVFLASIPVAFIAPNLAPLMWLALFFDPASRFFAADDRASGRG